MSERRKLSRPALVLLWSALALSLGVGILGRGYWTPDEPREADLAWRMSWQQNKAVPLLAGEAFCEKPPLTYWAAAAAIGSFGPSAWAARLPNLVYAMITALAVGLLGKRSEGPVAGVVAAAAISTFLLSYQVAIWLATDAPLLAAVSVALLGLHRGFHAQDSRTRLGGYCLMHAALACGFLCKSAAGWMVPVLALATLLVWERRWRELARWELYAGLAIQAGIVLTWVGFVYAGTDGPAHLKVFFWNNLVGRFAQVDAPADLQYAAAHRNSFGKYFVELPVYLWPWTLVVVAALRRAWLQRRSHTVRFALATVLPTLAVLSVAATARNIYLAPALPGVALLLGCWAAGGLGAHDRWDARALTATAVLLVLASLVAAAAGTLVGADAWRTLPHPARYAGGVCLGVIGALTLAVHAAGAVRRHCLLKAQGLLLFAYCALLIGPAAQIYGPVDAWQDLASIGRAIGHDAQGRDLVLVSPDETTRAFIDMYTRQAVALVAGPIDAVALERLHERLLRHPQSLIVAQLPATAPGAALRHLDASPGASRPPAPPPALPLWIGASNLSIVHEYALHNGRRYALLEPRRPSLPR